MGNFISFEDKIFIFTIPGANIFISSVFPTKIFIFKKTQPPPRYSNGGPLKPNGNSVVHESDSEGVSNIYYVLAIVPIYQYTGLFLLDNTGAWELGLSCFSSSYWKDS